MTSRLRSVFNWAFGLTAMAWVAGPASAGVVTISGAGLAGLDYRAGGGTAQYQSGAPDVAYLYTPDSGLSGASPLVYVNAANAGLPSLGTLGNFSASYELFGSSTPGGTAPYWLTYLNDPSGGYVGVISFGGPDLNGSTQIHVLCDYASADCTGTYWGDTLSMLSGIGYGATTFGELTVHEAGVEIGVWDNGNAVIPASASIQSITVSSVPEPGSVSLSATAILAVAAQRRRKPAA